MENINWQAVSVPPEINEYSPESTVILREFAERNGLGFTEYKREISLNSLFDYSEPTRMFAFIKGDLEFGIMWPSTYANIRHWTNSRNADRSLPDYFLYIEKTLPFTVQELIIDSRKQSAFITEGLRRDNLIQLESSEFGENFIITTEANLRNQAVAFLAPDLMNLLIDEFSDCDFEFFDNKVRIYFGPKVDWTLPKEFFDKAPFYLNKGFALMEKFSDKLELIKISDGIDSAEVEETPAMRKLKLTRDFAQLGAYIVGFVVVFAGVLWSFFRKVQLFGTVFLIGSIIAIALLVVWATAGSIYKQRYFSQKSKIYGWSNGKQIYEIIKNVLMICVLLLLIFTMVMMVFPAWSDKIIRIFR